jgi:hypothetical protein
MRLVDRDEGIEITTETMRLFRERGLIDEHGRVFHVAIDDWNAEFAVRHLAIAVRDPIDASKPLDSLDEWRECDDDQIESLWSDYKDHRQRIDPLGNGAAPLSDAEMSLIEDAVKKKELAVLMSFGSLKLASYLTTSAERPAS